jgi:hypothetical protein
VQELGIHLFQLDRTLFLILELNRPYGGVMQISIAPIRNALTQMNR